MTILAVARHAPVSLTEPEHNAFVAAFAKRFVDNLTNLQHDPGTLSVVVSSPLPRALRTAAVFSAALDGAAVVGDAAFNDEVSREDTTRFFRSGRKLAEYTRKYGLVVLITHQPIADDIQQAVLMDYNLGTAGFQLPRYHFGIHAVNLKTRDFLSFGQVAI